MPDIGSKLLASRPTSEFYSKSFQMNLGSSGLLKGEGSNESKGQGIRRISSKSSSFHPYLRYPFYCTAPTLISDETNSPCRMGFTPLFTVTQHRFYVNTDQMPKVSHIKRNET